MLGQLEHRFDALPRQGHSGRLGRLRAPDEAGARSISTVILKVGLVQEASSAIPVSSRYSSSVNCNDAACTFSSRCAIEEVPGMGSIIGDRFSNHANATWMGQPRFLLPAGTMG